MTDTKSLPPQGTPLNWPSREVIAREIRRAMLDNPTDPSFNTRAEQREAIANETADVILARFEAARIPAAKALPELNAIDRAIRGAFDKFGLACVWEVREEIARRFVDIGVLSPAGKEAPHLLDLRGLFKDCGDPPFKADAPAGSGGALADIAAERRRQIEKEGWSIEHDDSHISAEMAMAAAVYALTSFLDTEHSRNAAFTRYWPWDRKWFKPEGGRRDLIRAGALIVAEIERLDRKSFPSTNSHPVDAELRQAAENFLDAMASPPQEAK